MGTQRNASLPLFFFLLRHLRCVPVSQLIHFFQSVGQPVRQSASQTVSQSGSQPRNQERDRGPLTSRLLHARVPVRTMQADARRPAAHSTCTATTGTWYLSNASHRGSPDPLLHATCKERLVCFIQVFMSGWLGDWVILVQVKGDRCFFLLGTDKKSTSVCVCGGVCVCVCVCKHD